MSVKTNIDGPAQGSAGKPFRHRRPQQLCRACGQPYTTKNKFFCSRKCAGNTKHGLSETREHALWRDMKNRCRNPTYPYYTRYGGRGISVCERWNDFENFLEDMGRRPSSDHSIERIDNDKSYGPDNCKWATRSEQARNRSISWKPEEDAQLANLLAEGLKARDIASRLTKTRCAVSTHAARLKLRSRRGSGGILLPAGERQ